MTEQEYISKVCENIKQVRIQKEIKQVELAAEIGIDDSSLRRIESGRTSPTLKTLYRISQALKIDLSELLPETLTNTKKSIITKDEAEKLVKDHSHYKYATKVGTTIRYEITKVDAIQIHNTEEYDVVFILKSDTGLMSELISDIKHTYFLS